MKIPIYQVDAFTDTLFKGNPASVCPLKEWPERQTLHNIAAENNLSETAFYVKKEDSFEIRWFTPEVEVDLCGHGTLAAAHVIFNHSDFKGDEITFESMSGKLGVTRGNDLLALNFPATRPEKVETPRLLTKALGLPPTATYKSRDLLAVFDKEEDILCINPEFDLLHDILKDMGCLGIIVTAKGNNSDFVSRFFAPTVGINEDPVTGSAHTTLVPFWAEKLGKDSLHVYQLSRRQGELFCEMAGDRVLISGRAVTYLIGEIEI